jgi:hypothetical protein
MSCVALHLATSAPHRAAYIQQNAARILTTLAAARRLFLESRAIYFPRDDNKKGNES